MTTRTGEPLLRGFGIKAKRQEDGGDLALGASAPRFWNQGKAPANSHRSTAMSLCSAVLESRQSCAPPSTRTSREPLLRGFGIKAKRWSKPRRGPLRASAPRFWNQGKAITTVSDAFDASLCSAVLESRQSSACVRPAAAREPLLRGFGIKAKPVGRRPSSIVEPLLRGFGIKAKLTSTSAPNPVRASAPRFWNQGKACRC